MAGGARQPDTAKAVRVAELLRRKLKLRKPPIISVNIANAFGISVEFVHMNKHRENVVAFYDDGSKTIYVNAKAPIQLSNFAVARELGHYLMHPEFVKADTYRAPMHTDFYRTDDPIISEATAFATSLLAKREWMLDGSRYITENTNLTPENLVNEIATICVVPNRVVEIEREQPCLAN